MDTQTGQIITFLLTCGRLCDARLIVRLTRRLRQLLGRRLAGMVAGLGFTSRASVAALRATGVPCVLRLGPCPWEVCLRLVARGARSPTDRRGPWVDVTRIRHGGPQQLAGTYCQRWRVEQVLEELLNGQDLDHLVSYHLPPH